MSEEKVLSLAFTLDRHVERGVLCFAYRPVYEAGRRLRHAVAVDPARFLRSKEIVAVPPAQRRILMRLTMHHSGKKVVGLGLRGREGAEIAEEMVKTGHCCWAGRTSTVLQWGKPRQGEPDWDMSAEDVCRPVLRLSTAANTILPLRPPLYIDHKEGFCGKIETGLDDALAAAWAAAGPLRPEEAAAFISALTERFGGTALPFPPSVALRSADDAIPVPCVTVSLRTLTPMPGTAAHVPPQVPALKLEFEYENKRVPATSPAKWVDRTEGATLMRAHRNTAREAETVRRLAELGLVKLADLMPAFDPAGSADFWALPGDAGLDWHGLLNEALPGLEEQGWRVERDSRFTLVTVHDRDWYTELESSEPGWFDFEAGFKVDGETVNMLPVVHELLLRNRGVPCEEFIARLAERSVTVPLGGNRVAIVPGARLAVIVRSLFELLREKALSDDRRVRVDTWRAAEIADLESISASRWNAPEEIRALAQRLRAVLALSPQRPPRGFKGTLRPYQQLGLAWLRFLSENEFDGVLADDMGLGKTVEALAHILWEKNEKRLEHPCLIVAPTSLMKNWADEVKRFAPRLKTVVLHGPDRGQRLRKMDRADVVLTTYALLRWDADIYRDRPFSYVILDEAQFIKNHQAQVTRLARSLKARRRLCLTGTPMENHLGELWSLFHFLSPGFLGTWRAFKEQFRDPIEKEQNETLRLALARRVAPFLLRRTKEDVAPELPSRTEIVRSVELTDRQRDLYESVRLAMESRIREEVSRKGLAKSHIAVLDALLKLRQVCCDPRLVKAGADGASTADSGKLVLLTEMLPELIEEGRRILLFSQFVTMLKLIESEVQRLGLDYVMLTGSTRDRATPISRFQAGEVPLFLISLKAGGTGLNLTAADTVIHYDPWWNPAVERQATDRAHRIGQDKPVFVYKLLAEGTVEERIQELQKRKKDLVDGILTRQTAGRIAFEEADIEQLLAPIR